MRLTGVAQATVKGAAETMPYELTQGQAPRRTGSRWLMGSIPGTGPQVAMLAARLDKVGLPCIAFRARCQRNWVPVSLTFSSNGTVP